MECVAARNSLRSAARSLGHAIEATVEKTENADLRGTLTDLRATLDAAIPNDWESYQCFRTPIRRAICKLRAQQIAAGDSEGIPTEAWQAFEPAWNIFRGHMRGFGVQLSILADVWREDRAAEIAEDIWVHLSRIGNELAQFEEMTAADVDEVCGRMEQLSKHLAENFETLRHFA